MRTPVCAGEGDPDRMDQIAGQRVVCPCAAIRKQFAYGSMVAPSQPAMTIRCTSLVPS